MSAGVKRQRFRKLIVVFEMVVAIVLVVGSALLVKSFYRLHNVDIGFNPKNVVSIELNLPTVRYPFPDFKDYPTWPEMDAFYRKLFEETAALPGVEKVSVAVNSPLHAGWGVNVGFEGRAEDEAEETSIRPVSPEYFSVIGAHLLRGRLITEQDSGDKPMVVVVNQAFVRRHYGDEEALGKRITFWNRWRQIVGIVKDVKFMGPGKEAPPAIYPPFLQAPVGNFRLVVRTGSDPQAVVPSLQESIWSIDRQLAIYNVSTLDEMLSATLSRPRFSLFFVSLFGFVSLFLALVSIYGVVSQSVAQRLPEIGIRMAFGGSRRDILKLVLGEGARFILLGAAIGLATAFSLNRFLANQLFEVSTRDPLIFVAVPGVLVLVAFGACLLPSWGAAGADPARLLRDE